jgi:hypothetical protein
MKVIFLDHDGVICLSNNWGSRMKKQEKWGGRKLSMSMREIPIEHRFDNFDKKAINVLNQILEETGAEIVVSSDWKKWATTEELGEYYELHGIAKKPIDCTEFFYTFEEETVKSLAPEVRIVMRSVDQLEKERHVEILKWLRDHPEVEKWAAIDDLHMGIHVEASRYGPHDRDWGLSNFVWTPRDWEGIKQTGIKEKVLNFLK